MEKKTSILERKIDADPLAWGTPEMIRSAKKRKKAGLPDAPDISSSNTASVASTPSNTASPTKNTSEPKTAESTIPPGPAEPVIYPKIRAKYDLLIENVKASKGSSLSDKKIRIKNLEIRYQTEVQEKKYQKYTLWSLAGFLAVAVALLYAKSSLG